MREREREREREKQTTQQNGPCGSSVFVHHLNMGLEFAANMVRKGDTHFYAAEETRCQAEMCTSEDIWYIVATALSSLLAL